MTIEDKIRDEKLPYDINREEPKISALSSGKIDKYQYLTNEKILPSNQRRMFEQLILLLEKLKNKQKQLKIKEENK